MDDNNSTNGSCQVSVRMLAAAAAAAALVEEATWRTDGRQERRRDQRVNKKSANWRGLENKQVNIRFNYRPFILTEMEEEEE